jgi:hypothetical protein
VCCDTQLLSQRLPGEEFITRIADATHRLEREIRFLRHF